MEHTGKGEGEGEDSHFLLLVLGSSGVFVCVAVLFIYPKKSKLFYYLLDIG